MPSILLICIIALWVYYCMHLLIEANDHCVMALIPSNEDPYKVVAKKVIILSSFGVRLIARDSRVLECSS